MRAFIVVFKKIKNKKQKPEHLMLQGNQKQAVEVELWKTLVRVKGRANISEQSICANYTLLPNFLFIILFIYLK